MPRKAKEKVIENIETKTAKKVEKKPVSKSANKATKKVAVKSTKKTTSKEVTNKKIPSKKTATKKTTTTKTAVKKTTTKKATAKEATVKKKTSAKKISTKKASKKTTKKVSKVNKKSVISNTIGEYYDLPASYEQTIVKILAQTPTILFVYWDVSSKDRQKLMKQYGEHFFNDTTPYLLVINKTMNYQFEVDINDYANSWYLHIPDSDCEYEVTLMRRNKVTKQNAQNNIYITSSNDMQTPNDHILFEKLGKTVFFKNVKTNKITTKDISSFAFMRNIGKIYNIYDLYKEIYKDELNGDELGIKLSSSQFSSNFK